MNTFVICLVIATLLGQVDPHGYLNYPPQRSTMWRHGFGTPANYEDNELNCGGREQQRINGGKCGVCGDKYDADIKPNEAGGKYATGKIAGTFQSGARIEAEVIITANHKGYFEFRLCAHNDVTTPVNQSCLDQNLLRIENGSKLETKYYIGTHSGSYKMILHLPAGLTCSQCVLQWTYTAGNNWGGEGTAQEHFVNCADIAILPQGSQQITQAPPATPVPTPRQTDAPATARPTTPRATARPTPAPAVINSINCRGVGVWATGLTPWCQQNCPRGFCPAGMCTCDARHIDSPSPNCVAVSPYDSVPNMDSWCDTVCNHNPPYCPPTHCSCP